MSLQMVGSSGAGSARGTKRPCEGTDESAEKRRTDSDAPAVVAAPPPSAVSGGGQRPLHIVSWNVAGWVTTSKLITSYHGSIGQWLDKHEIDILCIQEVKIPSEKIVEERTKVGATMTGWDSFWATCKPLVKEKGQRGMNGVAVFARAGLGISAESLAFGDSEFDDEGRLIVVDFGSFVIFNVYVPNNGEMMRRLPFKMRFLDAMRKRMCELRAKGRSIILVGDLNIARRSWDVSWERRLVDMENLRCEGSHDPDLSVFLRAWSAGLLDIKERLDEREVYSVETRNSHTGVKFEKWKVSVPHPVDGHKVTLGKPCDSREEAEGSFRWDARYIEATDGSRLLARKAGQMSAAEIIEVAAKLLPVSGADWSQQSVVAPPKPGLLQIVADTFGKAPGALVLLDWIERVLADDGMVDAFAEVHPGARDRYTCWDQYRNQRYNNRGARIDYTIVDRALLPFVSPGELRTYGEWDPYSGQAGYLSAVGGGAWKPAPLEGGGLVHSTKAEDNVQFHRPHTGMIYMPPEYSDHIAVSLVLDFAPDPTSTPLFSKDATKRCQPQNKVRTLQSMGFFRKAPSGLGA